MVPPNLLDGYENEVGWVVGKPPPLPANLTYDFI